jgi:TIR domain
MNGIFISYRQEDAKPWALLLRDRLAEMFGAEHVFLDKDTLRAGNWREQIQEALAGCRVVLVVMGRRWLTITDDAGQPRLDRADDVHRQEIVLALSRDHITVIPVRVDGAPMPHAKDLPEDIRRLTDQQSHELSDSSMRREVDLKLLIADIERLTELKARPKLADKGASVTSESPSHKQWLVRSAKGLATVLVGSIAVLVIAEIALGWTFGPPEISLIVLIVLGITSFGAWLRTRWKEKNTNART